MDAAPDLSLFPGLLGVLARAGFADDALKLARSWGGTKRYIPERPCSASRICRIITLEAALALVPVYGGNNHDIPNMGGKAGPLSKVKQLLRRLDHLPTTDAAREAGCTARYVRMVRKAWR
jgi:hypothetical protein